VIRATQALDLLEFLRAWRTPHLDRLRPPSFPARGAACRRSIAHLAGIVTSFTVAHSITLVHGGGPGPAAGRAVEVLIALSIVYVAIEDLLDRGSDRRALVTFVSPHPRLRLRERAGETALPTGSILMPLLAFNLGVEAGQLAVVLIAVPFSACCYADPKASVSRERCPS